MRVEARAALVALASAIAAITIASCGARSSITLSGGVGGGAPGTGGRAMSVSVSSSTVGAGAAGAGGFGGAPVCDVGGGSIGAPPVVTACGVIAPAPGVMTLAGGADEDDDQPSPVLVAYEPPGVSVIFAKHPADGDARARVATFDAWGAWPPPAPTSWPIFDSHGKAVPGLSLLATNVLTDGERQFSLVYEKTADNVLSWFERAISACGAPANALKEFSGLPGVPTSAVMTPDGVGWLIALSRKDKPSDAYLLEFVRDSGVDAANFFTKACATTRVFGASAPTAKGWIVAAAGGTPFDGHALGCNTASGPIGPATVLTFATLPLAEGNGLTANGTLDASGTIESLVLVPSGGGARAIWAVDGGKGASTAGLDANAAVVSTGDLDMGPAQIGSKGVDAVAIGANFAVAAPTAKGVHVALFDAAGALMSSADIAAPGSISGVRLLASPADDALLAVWSERAPGAANRTLQAARLDCK